MKKKRIHPLLYIAFATLFSCGKGFLEVVPQGQRIAATVKDYDKLMNNQDFFVDQQWTPVGWLEPQIMGDEVAAVQAKMTTSAPFVVRIFRWDADIYLPTDQPPAFVNSQLTALYTFNKVIDEVMEASGGTEAEKAALRGEALSSRAWSYFQLINYYAKPYNAATAGSDPGFPIITVADATLQSYPRSTVQAMYDQIVSDLHAAILLLPQAPVIRTRFSRPAAEGLLGKVYLFMGKYEDALPLFDAAFAGLSGGDVQLVDHNGLTGPADPVFGPAGPGNDPNDFRESIVSKVFTSDPTQMFQVNNRSLLLTAEAAALYTSQDLRLRLYSATDMDGYPNPGGLLRKYGVRYTRYGLQLPELYLLRAECRARLNNLGGAVADLEELRSHRMPAGTFAVPAAIAGNREALIRFVIDERTREFAMEGYRWFDMRRLSADPLFAGTTYTHTLYNTDGTTTLFEMDQPNRLTMRIPAPLLLSNPEMQNNP